jgi:hypothetical protein
MGSKKSPTLPPTPTYIQDPLVGQANQSLFNLGQGLTSGSIYDQNLGLAEAVNTNPDITRLTLEGLQAQLAPQLRTSRQDIINQLEANNQLTGSTTASALGNIQTDYESQLVNAGAQAGIADINRALSNRVALFGTGLNTIQSAGQGAQGAQNAQNQFNLANYENQIAKVLGEQKQQSGGLVGALTGGLGGAALGIAAAPFTGGLSLGLTSGLAGIGAAAGGFGPSGTGGALFQSGAGLAGSRLGNTAVSGTSQAPIYSAGAIQPESIYGGLANYYRQNQSYYGF